MSICQNVDTDVPNSNPASKWSIGGQNGPKIGNYGFLSSKMCEEYYWWEVIISIRKLILVSLVMWSPGECKHCALLTWVRAGSEIRCG